MCAVCLYMILEYEQLGRFNKVGEAPLKEGRRKKGKEGGETTGWLMMGGDHDLAQISNPGTARVNRGGR